MVLLNTSWDVLAERQLEGPAPVKACMAWNGDGLKGCLLTYSPHHAQSHSTNQSTNHLHIAPPTHPD